MTGEIVPRWEWRAFGGTASPLAGLAPERVEESDEVYVLSVHADASVKVRAGLLDVKQLEEVDALGLERWRPVLKASFPLAAPDAALALERLGVPASGRGPAASLEGLVADEPGLVRLAVHKRRHRYAFLGCMAEMTELHAAGRTTQTIAVESEDAERVVAAVRALGHDPRENVCVARGLKALAGVGARRYAVIDVGTNSVKLHVGERAGDGAWRTIADRAAVTRLGEGLERAGRLGRAPIERTADAVAAMTAEARDLRAVEIAAVGTAGLRIAPNADELVALVRLRCGVEVEVIAAEEEARLAYLAAVAGVAGGEGGAGPGGAPGEPGAGPAGEPGSLLVFDTGGGSSQFTFGSATHPVEAFSVEVGAARYTERFGLDGPVTPDTLDAALAAIAADLSRLDGRPPPAAVVAMGGAVTNLAAVKLGMVDYDGDVVQGTVLDRPEIDRQIEAYRTRTAADRSLIAGLQPARAAVILAGACIVRTVLEKVRSDALRVSDRGLRHGVLAERFRLGPPEPFHADAPRYVSR